MTAAQKNYLLASFPRSGNTMVRLLLHHHFGFHMGSLYGQENVLTTPLTAHLNKVEQSARVAFWKTHGKMINKPWSTLLITRDGRDAITSLAHYSKHFGAKPHESIKALLHRQAHGASWKEINSMWLDRPGTVVIRYEDIVRHGLRLLEIALESLMGKKPQIIRNDPLPSFERYHSDHPKFFRSGKSGEWKRWFTTDEEAVFWRNCGDLMQHLGYAR